MGMVPVCLRLEKDVHQKLREEAGRRGLSLAALVREVIGERFTDASRSERDVSAAMAFVGSGRSGKGDISTHHDEYLAGLRK